MIYWAFAYYVFSLIYCGTSIGVTRANNISLILVALFAPILAPVFFGLRLGRR